MDSWEDKEGIKEEYFEIFRMILGPVPTHFINSMARSDLFCNEEGYLGPLPPGVDRSDLPATPQLEQLFDQKGPADLDESESDQIKLLLCSILQYGESDRPSASELLRSPWFASSGLEKQDQSEEESSS